LSSSTTYYFKVSAYSDNTGEGPLSDAVSTDDAWIVHTVFFNTNGGSYVDSSQSAGAGNSITLPSTTRSGYTFDGWYTSLSGGTRVGGAGSSYTPTSSVTLYAHWTQSGGGGGNDGGGGGNNGGGTDTQQLATPTGLQTYAGGNFVQISWNEVPLAYKYEVYRSTSANGTYSQITVSIGSGTGSSSGKIIANDSSPRSGTSYYKVKALPNTTYYPNIAASNLSDYVSVNN
jgi:uncharacterized repeat protein (TIGR02543 family)